MPEDENDGELAEQEKAATRIQAVQRGKKARQETQGMKAQKAKVKALTTPGLVVEAGVDVEQLGMMPHVPPDDEAGVVHEVDKGGWADGVGIRPGYTIISLNGTDTKAMDKKEFVGAMQARPLVIGLALPTKETLSTVERVEMQEDVLDAMQGTVEEAALPSVVQKLQEGKQVLTVEAGIEIGALGMTPHVPPDDEAGIINEVDKGGWAEKVGIRPGYMIRSLNGVDMPTMGYDAFVAAMKARPLVIGLSIPTSETLETARRVDQDEDEEKAREKAATKIQSMQRGKKARAEVAEKKKAKGAGAAAAAAAAAAVLDEDDEEVKAQEQAATKIQSIQRGKQARAEVAEKKKAKGAGAAAAASAAAAVLDEDDEEAKAQEKAATKIQSMQRGKKARAEVAEKKAAAKAKAKSKAKAKAGASADVEDDEEAKAQEKAATKIQSIQRGKKARAEVAEKKAAKAKAKSKAKAKAKQAAAGDEDEDEEKAREKAATKIQAMQRGKKARKEVEEKKATAKSKAKAKGKSKAKAKAKAKAGDDADDEEMEKAATKIQAAKRGKAARAEVEEMKRKKKEQQEEEKAATKIQAVHRGKAARADLNKKGKGRGKGRRRVLSAAEEEARTKLHLLAFKKRITTWEEIFRMFDTDNCGKIQNDEFLKLMRDQAQIDEESVTDKDLEMIFKTADVGDDGLDYATEFLPWLTSPPPVVVTVALVSDGEISTLDFGTLPAKTPVKIVKNKITQKRKVGEAFQLLSVMNGEIFPDDVLLSEVVKQNDESAVTFYLTDLSAFKKEKYCKISEPQKRGISSKQLNSFLEFISSRKESDSDNLAGWGEPIPPAEEAEASAEAAQPPDEAAEPSAEPPAASEAAAPPGMQKALSEAKPKKAAAKGFGAFGMLSKAAAKPKAKPEAKPEGDAAKPEGDATKPAGDAAKPPGDAAKPKGFGAFGMLSKAAAKPKAKPEAKPEGDAAKTPADAAEPAGDASKAPGDAAEPAADATEPPADGGEPETLASPWLTYSKMNMYHAMKWVITPLTKALDNRSYVEVVAIDANAQVPRWFVSHAWQNPVMSLVRCIEAHATARGLSRDTAGYWVCAFASSQKELEMKSADKKLAYMPVFEAMKHCMGMLLVLDAAGQTLSRIWCCFECSVATETKWYNQLDDKRVLFDVATADADKYRLITDGIGLTEAQQAFEESEPNAGWVAKANKERDFPVQTLLNSLDRISLETAEADKEGDRERLLYFMMNEGNWAEAEKAAAEKAANAEAATAVKADAEKADVEKADAEKTDAEKADAEKADAEKAAAEKAAAEKAAAEKAAAAEDDAQKAAAAETADAEKAAAEKADAEKATIQKISKSLRGFFAAVSWRTVAARSDASLWAKLSTALKEDELRSSISLTTKGIPGFSNQHLNELGRALSPGLTDLQLECAGRAAINNEGVQGLTSGLPKDLRVLDLNFTSSAGITDVGVRQIAATIPQNLETLKLDLSECDKVSDDSICALAKCFPALSGLELRVAGCSKIGDFSMEAVAELLPESVEQLSLDFTGTGLTKEMLEASKSLESVRQLQERIKNGERPRQRPSVKDPKAKAKGGLFSKLAEAGAVPEKPMQPEDSLGLNAFLKATKKEKKKGGPAKMLFGKKLGGDGPKDDEPIVYESAPPPKQIFGSSFKPTSPKSADDDEKKVKKRQSRKNLFGMSVQKVEFVKVEHQPQVDDELTEEEEGKEEEQKEPEEALELSEEDDDEISEPPLMRWVPPLTAAKDLPQERRPREYVPQDDEDPAVSDFFTWATCRWTMLHEVFKYYDHTGRFHNFRNVGAREFVEHVWWHGFEGNALKIFQQIQMESPGPNHGVLDATDSFGTISLAQLRRFEARYADLVKGVETPATRLAKALMRKRGSMLRAWRLDFDTRRSGLVAYADFIQACRRLGFSSEAKVLWNSFRPDTGFTAGAAPLEFREFDGQEAANLDRFAEALWTGVDFDINKAWTCIDPSNRGLVTLEEFTQGVRLLGFDGNSRLLFKGLDSTGLGRLKRHELDYVQTLSVSVARTQYCAPPIRALSKWAQVELGGPNGLLQKLGLLDSPSASLSVYDLTQYLQVLGYRGDARRTAMLAAKIGGGDRINGEMLYAVLADVGGHTSSPINIKRIIPDSYPKIKSGRRPVVKEQWRGGVDDFAASNVQYPSGLRNYFSTPTGGPAVMLQKEKRPKRREEINTRPQIRRKRHERPAVFDQHTAKLGHRLDKFAPEDSDMELEDPYLNDPDFADLAAQLAQQSVAFDDVDFPMEQVARGDDLADLFPAGYNPGKRRDRTSRDAAMQNIPSFQPPPRKSNLNDFLSEAIPSYQPPPRRSNLMPDSPMQPMLSSGRSGDKPAWDAGLYDMSARNSGRPIAQRKYFEEDQSSMDLKYREQSDSLMEVEEHKDKKMKKEKSEKKEKKHHHRKSKKIDDELEEIKRKYSRREPREKSESASEPDTRRSMRKSMRQMNQSREQDIPEPEPGF